MSSPSPARSARLTAAAGAFLILVGCAGDGPTGPPNPTLEIVLVGGDGQSGLAGSALTDPLQVRVQEAETGRPSPGVVIEWTPVTGEGASTNPARAATNDQGMASTRWTLGPVLGEYRVDATAQGSPQLVVAFRATAILPPSVTSVVPAEAAPGSLVTLTGENFSAAASENVVLFSGIRGRVTEAAPTRLTVSVPSCMPAREVVVVARRGALQSAGHELKVLPGATATDLALGEQLDLPDASGLECVRLGGGGREYLAVVSASSQIAAGRWPYSLTGLTAGTGDAIASPSTGPGTRARARVPVDVQGRWDSRLRRLETTLLERERAARSVDRPVATVPQVGERREFDVLNVDNGFTRVTATAVHVSARAAIYVDLDAPGGGLRPADFARLGEDFDAPIFPTVTSVFGGTSDLDANQRVVILFTPVVNLLTEEDADGFVGGFFFGLDLLLGRENSNEGEVFYALVPDPGGEFGDPRSRELVMDVIPAILAHEFQHMVHFNERVLVLGATTQEALWLSEALAQSAEDVVGEAFRAAGDAPRARQYQLGNWIRAERYLRDPGDVSLLVSQGAGSLAERGGAWLFLRYLQDQTGSDEILGQLTRTVRTGVANVSAVSGRAWENQFPDWSAALYLDETGVPVDGALSFPELNLREVIGEVTETFPLAPRSLGAADFVVADELWSASSDFFLIRPPSSGSVSLTLSGDDQGPASQAARQQLTLVRVR